MTGDHLASGVIAPCSCCQPSHVRLLAQYCIYDAMILHVGGSWPTSASWTQGGTHPAPPAAPEGFSGKYFATRRTSWTGTMSFANGSGPPYAANTNGYSGTADLDFEEVASTPRVWHAINGVSQIPSAGSVEDTGSTSRTSTPFGSGWTPPANGSSSGLGSYTMTIGNAPLGRAYFNSNSSSGGRLDARRQSWGTSGAAGVTRHDGADIVWEGWDGIIRESYTYDLSGEDIWDDEIQPSELTDAITADAAASPPWDTIDPEVLLDSSDITSAFFRQPLAGHSVAVNLSHSSFRFPPGIPADAGSFFPEQGAGSTFSRARHYMEFRDCGWSAAAVQWQTRESTDGGDTWGEWSGTHGARLALHRVSIDLGSGPETWLRSDPIPEDTLPEDYLIQVQRQIRLLSLSPA